MHVLTFLFAPVCGTVLLNCLLVFGCIQVPGTLFTWDVYSPLACVFWHNVFINNEDILASHLELTVEVALMVFLWPCSIRHNSVNPHKLLVSSMEV